MNNILSSVENYHLIAPVIYNAKTSISAMQNKRT